MMLRPHSTRVAFTLIEMMVALALSAMLIVAVMRLVVMIDNDYRKMPGRVNDAWLNGISDLIMQDAAQALKLDTDPKGVIRLTTFDGLDPITLKRTYRPAEVTYRIRTDETQDPLLVREQMFLDREPRGKLWVEPLAFGIRTIALQRTETKVKPPARTRQSAEKLDRTRQASTPALPLLITVQLQYTVQLRGWDNPIPYTKTFILP